VDHEYDLVSLHVGDPVTDFDVKDLHSCNLIFLIRSPHDSSFERVRSLIVQAGGYLLITVIPESWSRLEGGKTELMPGDNEGSALAQKAIPPVMLDFLVTHTKQRGAIMDFLWINFVHNRSIKN